MTLLRRLRAIGPGAVTTAAFIGPGTVTTATVAGASFGFALAWTLVFATIATIILQEMALRLGVVSRKGLGEAVVSAFAGAPILRALIAALLLAALFLGNAAYQGGNIAGAALGIEAAFSGLPPRSAAGAVAICAGAILMFGRRDLIERALVAMVGVMSLAFLATALIVRPDIGALLQGALVPSLPDGSFLVALSLVGTTVVPYNLFLHAQNARAKWAGAEGLADARFDAAFSIGVGGLASLLILTTAAASLYGSGAAIASGVDMARQLEPLAGSAARYLMAGGLFAAGLTSAITAPLAAAYVASEIFRFRSDPSAPAFRAAALLVLAVGAAAALTGRQPVEIIVFAQAANGLLLPLVAAFLLYAVNRRALMGAHANTPLANFLGGGVILVAAGLGACSLARALGLG